MDDQQKDPSPHLFPRGVGSGMAAGGLLNTLGIGAVLSQVFSRTFSWGTLFDASRLRNALKFSGALTVFDGVFLRVLPGAALGDKSMVGDGGAALAGAAALGVAATVVTVATGGADLVVIGGAVAIGSFGGRVLRDASPTIMHYTDDVFGKEIVIDHTPKVVREQGAKLVRGVIHLAHEGEHLVAEHTPDWIKHFGTTFEQVTHGIGHFFAPPPAKPQPAPHPAR